MSFIKTFSGKHFYYDRINKDDIDINDIAVSLSNICRFAGHLSHFYSVAQHAVLCSQLVPQEFAFEALMHDATEAYCQDIPAPLKRLLPDYKRMEEKIDAVIREKYGLPPVMSTPVKYADLIMLATERRDAHLAPNHLTEHARKIDDIFGDNVPNMSHCGIMEDIKKA